VLSLSLSVNLVMLSNGLVLSYVLGLSTLEFTLEKRRLFQPLVVVRPSLLLPTFLTDLCLLVEGRVSMSVFAKLNVSFITSALNLTFSTLLSYVTNLSQCCVCLLPSFVTLDV